MWCFMTVEAIYGLLTANTARVSVLFCKQVMVQQSQSSRHTPATLSQYIRRHPHKRQ